jgi:type I restriction enzyme, S subunit
MFNRLLCSEFRTSGAPALPFYWLRSIPFVSAVSARSVGVSYPAINPEELADLPFLLLEKKRQRTIADFLDRETAKVDAATERKNQILMLLEEERQAKLNQIVLRGTMFGPGTRYASELSAQLPRHWSALALKHVIQGSPVNGVFKKSDAYGSGVLLLNVYDIYRRDFVVNEPSLDRVQVTPEEAVRYAINPGDVFIVRSSLKLEGIGRAACYQRPAEPAVFECHLIRIRPKRNIIDSLFLAAFLNSAPARQWLIAASKGVTMATLDQDQIATMPIVVPPVQEQINAVQAFQTECSAIDRAASNLNATIALLREYRSALITAAVTGQLDIRRHEKQLEALA